MKDMATGVKLVHENGLHMDGIYGYENTPLNLDTINLPYGYIYRIIDESGLTGSKPFATAGGGNSGLLMGFSSYIDGIRYGGQIFFGFSTRNIVTRNAVWTGSVTSWSAWGGSNSKMVSIFSNVNIPTSATSYNCPWQNYNMLYFNVRFYNNQLATVVVPRDYFEATGSGSRVIVRSDGAASGGNTKGMEIWQNGSGKIYVVSSAKDAATGLTIYGVI